MRRGDYRNYYKGHMDKIKGEGGGGVGGGFSWGGVEGWEEKAHNCNRITIKIKIKKKTEETADAEAWRCDSFNGWNLGCGQR